MLIVTGAMWAIVASMWIVADAMRAVAASMGVITCTVQAIKAFMSAAMASVCTSAASVWADTASTSQTLCGILKKTKSPDSGTVQAFQVEVKNREKSFTQFSKKFTRFPKHGRKPFSIRENSVNSVCGSNGTNTLSKMTSPFSCAIAVGSKGHVREVAATM